MITLTVVRHGESTDNLKSCWAGWANAPLSNHGMNQAKALGESYKQTKVDHIYASDLLRALWTAQQIERQQSEPKPTFTVSELLREQFFGEAEQQPFGEKGGYERKPGRQFRFPGGETLEDVRARANRGIDAYIEQHLQANKGKGPMSAHIVVVAHGIFNSEFIGALLARRGTSAPLQWGYKGMTNTGWTRLEVGYADEAWSDPNPSLETDPDEPQPPSSRPTEPPPKQPLDSSAPKLAVKILCTDITTHLERVHRQKGGIGSQGFDQKQTDLRAFFAGASTDK